MSGGRTDGTDLAPRLAGTKGLLFAYLEAKGERSSKLGVPLLHLTSRTGAGGKCALLGRGACSSLRARQRKHGAALEALPPATEP
jgi:hypothetical protein